VFLYPCTCLIEGTNLSEGRGTPLPFEVMGAPDLDEFRLAETLNRLELKGVRFRPTVFKPSESKHTGQICRGIQVHLTDRRCFQPLTAGLHLLRVLLDIYPLFSFLETSWEGVHPHIDLLMGSSQARIQLLAGSSVAEITAEWARSEKAFRAERKPYLLYD